jgi:formate dehydrogenase major subunit
MRRRGDHLDLPCDESNPYFTFDPAKCIVCSRCVRACDEVQGTLALTVQGRGFASKIVASQDEPFLSSECVSCGACIQACPTEALIEKTVLELGAPEWSEVTTCGYCGGRLHLQGRAARATSLVRMVPWKDGKANHGHSCVKGRFAWGYATHKERVLEPMIRASIDDPWRTVSWDEAIAYAASEFARIEAKYGAHAIGGITSSRCTERGDLPRPEDDPGAVRGEQRRHLRPRLPLAHRLWPEDHAGHLGRHPGLRQRRALRRHGGDRRQSRPTATRCSPRG